MQKSEHMDLSILCRISLTQQPSWYLMEMSSSSFNSICPMPLFRHASSTAIAITCIHLAISADIAKLCNTTVDEIAHATFVYASCACKGQDIYEALVSVEHACNSPATCHPTAKPCMAPLSSLTRNVDMLRLTSSWSHASKDLNYDVKMTE